MIEKIDHYAINTPTFPSVYDQEAMTALELVGRLGGKVNECVETVNSDTTIIEGFSQRLTAAEAEAHSAIVLATEASGEARTAQFEASRATSLAQGASGTASQAVLTAVAAQNAAGQAAEDASEALSKATAAVSTAGEAGAEALEAAATAAEAKTAAESANDKADALSLKTMHIMSATTDWTKADKEEYADNNGTFDSLRIISPVFEVTAFFEESHSFSPDFIIAVNDVDTPTLDNSVIQFEFYKIGDSIEVTCSLGDQGTPSETVEMLNVSPHYHPFVVRCGVNRDFKPYATICCGYDTAHFVFETLNAARVMFDAFEFEGGMGYDNLHPTIINVDSDSWTIKAMVKHPTSAPVWVVPPTDVCQLDYTLYPMTDKIFVLNTYVSDYDEVQSLHAAYQRIYYMLNNQHNIPERIVIITPDYNCQSESVVAAEQAQANIIAHLCEEYGIEVYVTVPLNQMCRRFVSQMYGNPHYIDLHLSIANMYNNPENYNPNTFPYYIGSNIASAIAYMILEEVL